MRQPSVFLLLPSKKEERELRSFHRMWCNCKATILHIGTTIIQDSKMAFCNPLITSSAVGRWWVANQVAANLVWAFVLSIPFQRVRATILAFIIFYTRFWRGIPAEADVILNKKFNGPQTMFSTVYNEFDILSVWFRTGKNCIKLTCNLHPKRISVIYCLEIII